VTYVESGREFFHGAGRKGCKSMGENVNAETGEVKDSADRQRFNL